MVEFLGIGFAVVCITAAIMIGLMSMARSWVLSPLALFVVVSVLFLNIGFILYFLGYADQPWALSALVSASVGLLAVALGGALAMVSLRTSVVWPRLIKIPVLTDIPYPVAIVSSLFIFGISLVYFYLLGYIPLIEALKALMTQGFVSGLANTFRVGRDVYVNPDASYIPLQGLLEIIRYFGLPVVAVWFLHFYRHGVRRSVSLFFLLASSLLTVLTGQRWPLMYLLTILLVYGSWTTERFYRVLYRVMFVALAAASVLSILLGRQVVGTAGSGEAFFLGVKDLATRILAGNVEIPFLSYELFPQHEEWLYGQSWLQNLGTYLPGPAPSYPVTFYRLVTGDSRGFSAPPDFYTEAYINFGFIGVIALSFMWGYCLVGLQRFIVVVRGSLLYTSVMALMTVMLAFSAISGVSFLVGGLITAALLLGLVWGQKLFSLQSTRGQGAQPRR